MAMRRVNDNDEAARKYLKVFVGGLPMGTNDRTVGGHFSRYGHVEHIQVLPPKEEEKKSAYAFVTFKYAADADAAILDPQNFPGASRPLTMGFAQPRRREKDEQAKAESQLCEA